MTEEIVRFAVGKTYYTRSAYDHNCIFKFTVCGRTAQFVIGPNGARAKIRVHNGVEQIQPYGNYSFAPVISADKPVVEIYK